MKCLSSLKRSSPWPVYPALPERWMQPLRSILLASAAEGEGTGMEKRHDCTHTHRQCHDHRAASEPMVTPSTAPSTSVHPPSLPTSCRCGSGQIPHSVLLPGKEEHLGRGETGDTRAGRGSRAPVSPSPAPRFALSFSAASLPFMQTIPSSWVIPKLLVRTASLPACHYLFVIQSMSALTFLFKAFLLLQFAWASKAVEAGPNISASMPRKLYSFKEAYAMIDLQNETLPHN